MGNNKSNGRISAKVGIRFNEEIGKIQDARLLNGKSKKRPSVKEITNLIVEAKNWSGIAKDIIELNSGKFDNRGN